VADRSHAAKVVEPNPETGAMVLGTKNSRVANQASRRALVSEPRRLVQSSSNMKNWRTIAWARLRVTFGALLLILFALGALLVYTSSLANPQSGHGRSDLRNLGVALIALSVTAAIVAALLKRHLSQDD
jgi:hypothetical protein